MWNKIKELVRFASINGIHLPFVYDPVTGKPSITLLFPYATFCLSFLSVVGLHFRPSLLVATLVSIMFWALSVVFYMIRSIQKAKIDLDDKSIELEGEEETPEAPKSQENP